MALPVRKSYKGAPVNTTLSALLGAGSTSCTVGSVTGWPTTFPFYVVIEPGTSREEKVKVTAATGTTLTIVRAQDNTTDVEHPSASTVYPVFTAIEADEANQVASAMTTKGDLITTDGSSINRLAVGATNTHVLQVDSTATNGIKWGQVATAGIADSAVTSAKIADGTIVDADINAAAAIGLSKLATGALPTAITVASANLVDGTIVDADISASAAIALSKLETGALPTAITVASANLVDGTIATADIANSAVTTAKIADAAITTAKLAAGVAISGPTGPTGPTGATGAQGPTGPAGPVNTDVNATANTAALRSSTGSLNATEFYATNSSGTSPFYQAGTFTYIGLNCGRVDNTDTIYNDVVSGRTVLVGASASTLGTSASSRRFKENIVDAAFDIQDVYALRPVRFDYNDLVDAETDEYKYNQFGLIAEEVAETSLSFLVSHDDNGLPRHIKYELLAVALVSALKEQNERIAALEARITQLEGN